MYLILHALIHIASSCWRKDYLDWAGPLVLCESEVARVPPDVPGVYLLAVFDRYRGAYPPVYVGKTADLSSRLIQHLEARSTSPDLLNLRSRVGMYFCAAPVIDRVERDAIESGLIRLFRPRCNRQVPRTQPMYPNLPTLILR